MNQPEIRKVTRLLGLKTRTYNVLRSAGLIYIDQLEAISANELLQIPGFGGWMLHEVREALKKHSQK